MAIFNSYVKLPEGSSTKNVTHPGQPGAAVSHPAPRQWASVASGQRWDGGWDVKKSPETNPGKIPGLVISYIAIENGDLVRGFTHPTYLLVISYSVRTWKWWFSSWIYPLNMVIFHIHSYVNVYQRVSWFLDKLRWDWFHVFQLLFWDFWITYQSEMMASQRMHFLGILHDMLKQTLYIL